MDILNGANNIIDEAEGWCVQTLNVWVIIFLNIKLHLMQEVISFSAMVISVI